MIIKSYQISYLYPYLFLIQLLKSLKSLNKCDSIIQYRIIFTDKNLSSIIDRSFNSNPSFRRVEKIKSIESRYPISTFIDFLFDTHARFAGRGNSGGDNLHLFMIHEAGTGQQQSGNLLKTSTIRDPEILTRNRSRNRDVSRRKWPHLHAAWMCVAVDRFWLTGRGGEKKEEKKKKMCK